MNISKKQLPVSDADHVQHGLIVLDKSEVGLQQAFSIRSGNDKKTEAGNMSGIKYYFTTITEAT
jgi:hypothetical protein